MPPNTAPSPSHSSRASLTLLSAEAEDLPLRLLLRPSLLLSHLPPLQNLLRLLHLPLRALPLLIGVNVAVSAGPVPLFALLDTLASVPTLVSLS